MGEVGQLWTLPRDQVDPGRFRHGIVGPYRLGRVVRKTAVGEVSIALSEAVDHVLEIELFTELEGSDLAGPDGKLLQDLNHVVGLAHRHVANIVGAGMHGRTPYVVRTHRLGRTLDEVAIDDPDLFGGILHAVADAVTWLADQGAHPGACALGGFDKRDVFLGFDGSITLVGIGLKLLRDAHDPVGADRRSLELLANEQGITLGDDPVTELRHRFRDACAARASLIGAQLRSAFEAGLVEERAWFGLSTLH